MYTSRFFERREARAVASADALVPRLVELLRPRSVIDIGCANGLWLAAFSRNGVPKVRGVDGPWVPREALRVPAEEFSTLDLGSCPLPYPLGADGESFDMVLCLELLEHVSGERADALVDALCRLSGTLIVSAAVPHQGGTGHVNEQWPDYWRERFAARGYVACDFLRIACWDDERIAPWYRQNIIGYFRGEVPPHIHVFARAQAQRLVDRPLALCHPAVFSYKLGKLRGTLRNPLKAGIAKLRRRWG